MLCFLGKICKNQQKSAKICENLRLGSVWVRPLKRALSFTCGNSDLMWRSLARGRWWGEGMLSETSSTWHTHTTRARQGQGASMALNITLLIFFSLVLSFWNSLPSSLVRKSLLLLQRKETRGHARLKMGNLKFTFVNSGQFWPGHLKLEKSFFSKCDPDFLPNVPETC